MLGGFVWDAGHQEPRPGLYRTLMEALESGVAPAMYAKTGVNQPTAYTEDGVAYSSADPNARGVGWSDNPKERLVEAQRKMFEVP